MYGCCVTCPWIILEDTAGKSTVVKGVSGVMTVRFKNELQRNITIKLGYVVVPVLWCTGDDWADYYVQLCQCENFQVEEPAVPPTGMLQECWEQHRGALAYCI